MKQIRFLRTLLWYDGPQLFEAIDEDGRLYLAEMVEEAESADSHDVYLVVPVTDSQISRLLNNSTDLHATLLDAGAKEWFLTTTGMHFDQPFPIVPQSTPIAEYEQLGEPGFSLGEPFEQRPPVSNQGAAQPIAVSENLSSKQRIRA